MFYLGADRRLMAVAVKPGSRFEAGIAKPLFEVRFSASTGNTSRFDVARDGRFLIPVEQQAASPQSMIAVINWAAGLKR